MPTQRAVDTPSPLPPAFPKSWRDRRAFVCGPTGNLLGMYDVRPKESGYESVNAFSFVASADEWFSPIVAEVGPDGNMWIADWYNFIIQHNPTPNRGRGGYDAKRGTGNAHVNPNRDRQHGRIYRVAYEGNSGGKIKSLADAKDRCAGCCLKRRQLVLAPHCATLASRQRKEGCCSCLAKNE